MYDRNAPGSRRSMFSNQDRLNVRDVCGPGMPSPTARIQGESTVFGRLGTSWRAITPNYRRQLLNGSCDIANPSRSCGSAIARVDRVTVSVRQRDTGHHCSARTAGRASMRVGSMPTNQAVIQIGTIRAWIQTAGINRVHEDNAGTR